ncbi:MAG TPA: ion channel [Herpetosiphonaceae bacterium]|nr:ion channel [Herpetosiphonaceae bacterium]
MNLLHLSASVAGPLIVCLVLWDAFETMIVPRPLLRVLRFRLAKLFYPGLWAIWRRVVHLLAQGGRREAYLGAFGPLSVLGIIGIWAVSLVLGFGLLHWGVMTPVNAPDGRISFGTYLYLSGVTFFTLGYGDVTPRMGLGRSMMVLEAGVGFIFLAVVISYLPLLYQAFARREVGVAAMYRRAGTPPTPTALLWRYGARRKYAELVSLVAEWEQWTTELQETYRSYPMLALYRSHRSHQSWLATLTTMLDSCALLTLNMRGMPVWHEPLRFQAELTFEIGCEIVEDLLLLLELAPPAQSLDRLGSDDWAVLHAQLALGGLPLSDSDALEAELARLRRRYEPGISALASRLLVPLPPWVPGGSQRRDP